jgi:hypothetical protein
MALATRRPMKTINGLASPREANFNMPLTPQLLGKVIGKNLNEYKYNNILI